MLREAGGAILVIGFLAFLVIALVISAVRRGWNGVLTLLAVMAILAVLGAMLLPALSAAKRKAQRINSVNNLKQIGIAARVFAGDNNDRLPVSFDEMKNELGTDKVTYDTETGQRYTYLGGGMSLDSLKPDSVLAYSPIVERPLRSALRRRQRRTDDRRKHFAELSQRGLVQLATPQEIAAEQQRQAIARGQFAEPVWRAVPAPAEAQRRNCTAGRIYAVRRFRWRSDGGAPTNHGEQPSAGISGVAVPPPRPTVAGIRSLRIELPQTGQPFLFTKVLNVRDEPLSIRARIMSLHTFQTHANGVADGGVSARPRSCGGGNGAAWIATLSSSPSRWR